ncbi:MAG: V-type ATPase subunit [Candidatus Pacebacteria bacterium]|nr:V-type ATPase subunit [Candidatus Paceibacterota bacterium]
METSYIYSSSRIKVVEKKLLNESDIERLLASYRSDLVRVLRETYLSSYIVNDEVGDLFKALELSVLDSKRLLEKIAPDPKLFEFWWVRYDFQNLRVFLRMKSVSLTNEEILPYLSKLGKYDPESLLERIQSNAFDSFEPEFKIYYEKSIKSLNEEGFVGSDQVIDAGYFALAKRLAEETKNKTIKQVIGLQIDLHNIKTRLRTLQVDRTKDNSWFIVGGSFDFSEIEKEEQVLKKLQTFGNAKYWQEAIAEYKNEGHSTLIDVQTDDFLLKSVREINGDVFSLSSLLSYFIKCQHNALVVQAIITGKESGQGEEIIRKRLRNIYV